MRQVRKARERYRPGALGSSSRTSYMLIKQYQFPDTYDEHLDKYCQADHDRIFQADHVHASKCFEKHTGNGECYFEDWARSATNEQIMTFLVEVLKEDHKISWTGYRILGSVHLDNGFTVFTLEIFAKHPETATPVYTYEDAPNTSFFGGHPGDW